MPTLNFIVLTLLLTVLTSASPLPHSSLEIKFPPVNSRGLLCKIPVIKQLLCPRGGSSQLNVQTPVGTARGTLDDSGANRFTVRYASASRWGPSSPALTWTLPNDATDVTTLPLACPQPGADPSSFSEDCLSMILYVPRNLNANSNVPTLVWIHGGSFIVGSATGPGLNGSKLAIATNSIVAVVQYRLGALGFMSPDGNTNLGLTDMINALKFLKLVLPSFGGGSKITLAGQSSGANMIRALLATPTAESLFQSAILQSDPMDYGFLAPSAQKSLQNYFSSLIDCAATDTSCLNALSLDTIIDAQMNVFVNGSRIEPSAGIAQPIRVVRDGTLITSPLDSTAPFPRVNKPLLISSVLTEAGPAIFGQFKEPLPLDAYVPIVTENLGNNRTQTVLSSSHYVPIPSADGKTDIRFQLQTMGTDYVWKCSGWTFARNWVQNGGTAYVGLYSLGATYPTNEGIPFCTQAGSVCHEDDIQIVFGTVPNPTSAQSALTAEMQERYKAFMGTGDPNTSGISTWSKATSADVRAQMLGGLGKVAIGACDIGFWGQAVPYDYQVFSI